MFLGSLSPCSMWMVQLKLWKRDILWAYVGLQHEACWDAGNISWSLFKTLPNLPSWLKMEVYQRLNIFELTLYRLIEWRMQNKLYSFDEITQILIVSSPDIADPFVSVRRSWLSFLSHGEGERPVDKRKHCLICRLHWSIII